MSTIMTCRNCATMLRVPDTLSSGMVCPQCLAPLDESAPAALTRAPNLLRDVRRDQNTVGWILGVLIALCVAGIGLTFVVGLSTDQSSKGLACLLLPLAFCVLDVLVFVTGVRRLALFLLRESNVVRILGFLVLTMGLCVAIMVFFTAVCGTMLGKLAR